MKKLQLCIAGHGALDFLMRHLGHQQMTTDTAFGVTKRVIIDRGGLSPHSFPSTTG